MANEGIETIVNNAREAGEAPPSHFAYVGDVLILLTNSSRVNFSYLFYRGIDDTTLVDAPGKTFDSLLLPRRWRGPTTTAITVNTA